MKEIVVLEWIFAPIDYLEQPIPITGDNYEMTIDKGKVEARIEAQYYDSEPNFRMKLHESLKSRFYAASILNRRPFELSEPSMNRIHPDGRIDRYLFAQPGKYVVTGCTADMTLTDRNGKVVRDTRGERIRKREGIADLVEKHRANSPILQGILDSWYASLLKPENELVYLYDVRDALSTEFGGKEATCRALSISDELWGRFGYLANEEPLKQGRHRGRNLEILRDATEDELVEARTFIRELIEKYLDYLENVKHP
jgi:hypothetical protein